MELWIRSQDRETLRLAEMLDIYELEDDEEKRFVIEESGVDIGCYKSKERALKILDEIQSILNLKDMYKYDRGLVLKSWENVDEEQVKIIRQQMSVYEMPKE